MLTDFNSVSTGLDVSRSVAADPERHRRVATGRGTGEALPAVHQRRGSLRSQRAGHCAHPGIAARHRIPVGLQLQVRPQSAAGAAAGRQSHRMRPLRAQTPHSFQTLPCRPHRNSILLPQLHSFG